MSWVRSVISIELRKIFAYRSDFWVSYLGQSFIQLVVATALWSSLFLAQDVKELNGYNLETMIFYYLIVPMGTKILMGENIGFLSREIYDGSFTRYLIYPINPFHYKTVTFLTYSCFYAIQLFIIYTFGVLFFSSFEFHLGLLLNIIMGVSLFLIAAVTFMHMSMSIEILALWADNIWTLGVLLRFLISFLGGGLIPLSFFPDWGQLILKFTPFPYLISLPTQTILGRTTITEVIQGTIILIFWAFFFKYVVSLLWNRGSKHYAGVGI